MRNDQKNRTGRESGRQPTHVVKQLRQQGERNVFEHIGAAWTREDGSLFVKLHGVQIVSEGFSIYPADGGAQ